MISMKIKPLFAGISRGSTFILLTDGELLKNNNHCNI